MSGLLTQNAAGDDLQFKPADSWTVERKFNMIPTPASNIPFSILLLDRQYYVRPGACFVRHVRQIHHRDAAKNLSKINIPFAAHREKLTIHWIRIWRAGNAIEQISSHEALETQASKDPNRLIAHFDLKDLRPEDALDVAYSTRAIVPARQFAVTQAIRQRLPIVDWHLSAILPADATLESQLPAEFEEPTVRKLSEGSQFHHWHAQDVPPLDRHPGAPAWFPTNPELQLSTYGSWLEVAAEINQLWQIKPACERVRATAESMAEAAGGDTWETARRACRFVQDEIANLPVRSLTSAPAAPSAETLENGAGDCRAKACLLIALLRASGIPAAPVLVSRARGRAIANSLPAATLFDHVLVRGRIEDTDFWIDPSASLQAGPIQETVLPAYGFGLQVSPRTNCLSPIPKPAFKANEIKVTEHFTVAADHSAHLSISTKATGIEANRLRARQAETGTIGVAEEGLAELKKRYPGVTRTGELSLDDKPETNEIEVQERFEIPVITRNGSGEAIFSPLVIQRNLPVFPRGGESPVPLALTFPCNIQHLTVIDTPWASEDSESQERLPGSGFVFSFKGTTKGSRHTRRYSYNTLGDHIDPTEFNSARERLASLRSHLDYRLTPPPLATTSKVKSGKGSPIIKDRFDDPNRGRNSAVGGIGNLLRPIIAVAGAIALFFIVKSTFKEKAIEQSKIIKDKKIAEIAAQPAQEVPAELPPEDLLPDDLHDYLPPLAPLPGPAKDLEDLEFGLGETATGESASDKKNATSGDWKLSK